MKQELKLLISTDGKKIKTKGELMNIAPIELIGIYSFLEENSSSIPVKAIAIQVKLSGEIEVIKTKYKNIMGIPEKLIFRQLKKEAIKKINLKLSLTND